MPVTISEALRLDDAMPVIGLRGKIKAAFEAKTGQRSDGEEWCFVPLIVTDDSGAEIRATWFSPSTRDHKALKGRPVEISARKNSKNQQAGAKIKHSMYQGKPQIGITVDGDHLRFLDNEAEGEVVSSSPASSSRGPKLHTAADLRPGFLPHTDTYLIEAVGRWTAGLRAAICPEDPKSVPLEILQPLLSTFLIAATSDRSSLAIIPPETVASVAAKVQAAPATGDPLGGALDGYDAPTDEIPEDLDWK